MLKHSEVICVRETLGKVARNFSSLFKVSRQEIFEKIPQFQPGKVLKIIEDSSYSIMGNYTTHLFFNVRAVAEEIYTFVRRRCSE